MYPEYIVTYIITLIFSVMAIWYGIKLFKVLNQDNNLETSNEEKETSSVLDRYKVLTEEKKPVGNIILREMLKLPLEATLMWYIMFAVLTGKNLFNQDPMMLLSIYLLPIFAVLLPYFIKALFYIDIEDKLIQKCDLNINENLDITKVKGLRIFRPMKDVTFEKYFIVDENNNLLYKIQKKGNIKPKYIISDQNDIKQGEINIHMFSLTSEYIVRLIGEEPYSVRAKSQFARNYDVNGRNYIVEGDPAGIGSIIYNSNGEEEAVVMASIDDKDNITLSATQTVIVNSNSIDLTLIAFCVTYGNYHRAMRQGGI